MEMEMKRIEYGSAEYSQMVALRKVILRDPLGLVFTEADLAKDKDDILLGCYEDKDKLIGACILSHVTEYIVQLRQMAVSENHQGKNIGRQLLEFAEENASKRKYKTVCLHARKTAIKFYEKAGYKSIGEEFVEVGIPHIEMTKELI